MESRERGSQAQPIVACFLDNLKALLSLPLPQSLSLRLELGLGCRAQALSRARRAGASLRAVLQASYRAGFSCCRAWAPGHTDFRSCCTWPSLLQGMWQLPGLGTEPMFPASEGEFLFTAPPESASLIFYNRHYQYQHCISSARLITTTSSTTTTTQHPAPP